MILIGPRSNLLKTRNICGPSVIRVLNIREDSIVPPKNRYQRRNIAHFVPKHWQQVTILTRCCASTADLVILFIALAEVQVSEYSTHNKMLCVCVCASVCVCVCVCVCVRIYIYIYTHTLRWVLLLQLVKYFVFSRVKPNQVGYKDWIYVCVCVCVSVCVCVCADFLFLISWSIVNYLGRMTACSWECSWERRGAYFLGRVRRPVLSLSVRILGT